MLATGPVWSLREAPIRKQAAYGSATAGPDLEGNGDRWKCPSGTSHRTPPTLMLPMKCSWHPVRRSRQRRTVRCRPSREGSECTVKIATECDSLPRLAEDLKQVGPFREIALRGEGLLTLRLAAK